MKPPRERLPEFEKALEVARRRPEAPQPYCLDDPSYTLYSTPPDGKVARDMCEPCELLAICKKSALHERPVHGVLGGIAWVNGRQWHLRRTVEHDLELEGTDDELDDIGELIEIRPQEWPAIA